MSAPTPDSRSEGDTIRGHAYRTVESDCQYMLPTLLSMAKGNPKLKVLDVGCGPGSITLGFAHLLPEGELTGLDNVAAVLGQAKKAAGDQGVTNASFIKGDAYSLPFEDGTFDLVHTHQVVVHLAEHVKAIKELIRVTKKGGVVCMREGDAHTYRFYPANPICEDSWELAQSFMALRGCEPDLGRRLKAYTIEAGVPSENIVATAGTWCYSTREQRQTFGQAMPDRLAKGPVADVALEHGLRTREQLDQYAEAWAQWAKDDDAIFFMLHGQVIARV